MKSQEKEHLCNAIRTQIENFISEWKTNPSHWFQEIDVQFEISQRINRVLKDMDLQFIRAPHSHYRNIHEFSRVTCEPYVYLGGDKPSYAHPDIVVWDDDESGQNTLNSGRWPVIWACEIKYTSAEPKSTDFVRLQQMLSDKILFAGCWLKLIANGNGGPSHKPENDPNLWIIEERVVIP
jgi:hypothetical protein